MKSFRFKLIIVLMAVFSILSSSCSEHTIRSNINMTVRDNTPKCAFPYKNYLKNLFLVQPTVGVFIGVSEYGTEAKVFSTPAHSISACLFQSTFFQAAYFHDLHAKQIWMKDSDQQGADKWHLGNFGATYIDRKDIRHTYWLKTIADLRLDLSKPTELYAFRNMSRIPGVRFKGVRFFEEGIPNGQSFHTPKIGEFAEIWEADPIHNEIDLVLKSSEQRKEPSLTKPVDKNRMLAAIHDAINEARKSFLENGRVLLIIYISAHGQIWHDGQPYILPSDAVAKDPTTWLAYRDIIATTRKFLEEGGKQPNKHAIVFLDTCQTNVSETSSLRPARFRIPQGMTLVQSASPGQYAWHWTSATKEQGTINKEEKRWGFPKRPPEKLADGPFEKSTVGRMSVLPLASTCFVNDELPSYLDKADRAFVIVAHQWIESMKDWGDIFMENIPDKQASGMSQDINIQYGTEIDRNLPIFLMMPVSDD